MKKKINFQISVKKGLSMKTEKTLSGRTRLAKYAKQCGNKELEPKTREKNLVNCNLLLLLPFAPRAPALDNTNNIIWCVTRAWCRRTDRTSPLLTKIVLHCERTCETILTKYEHQCASADIVDNSLKNVYRNVSIYRKSII